MLPKKPQNIKDNYNSFILLKFYEEELFVDDLRQGNLFMRSLESFANMKDLGRGDELENKEFVVFPGDQRVTQMRYVETEEDYHLEFSTREPLDEFDKGIYFMAFDDNSISKKIYSLYVLWYDLKTGEFELPDDKMMKEFGEYCCVIYKPLEFLKRVSKNLKGSVCDFVDYVDLYDKPIQEWNPFYKDKNLYSHQSELRILFESEEKSITHIFDINNDLTDITFKVKSKDFFSKFRVENRMLYIPFKIDNV